MTNCDQIRIHNDHVVSFYNLFIEGRHKVKQFSSEGWVGRKPFWSGNQQICSGVYIRVHGVSKSQILTQIVGFCLVFLNVDPN